MQNLSQNWRRWFATLALALTVLLLLIGQTFLKPILTGKFYIVYWLICLFFTVFSILLALVELRFINEESKKEHKELISKTVSELSEIMNKRDRDKKNMPSKSEKDRGI